MKWITLKMHMIPMIFQEIDAVTERYISLLNSIRKKEAENEETKDDQNEKDEFNDIRESITKRINELEEFYENNIEDIRVTNFEKARLRLKKLLMYDTDTINKIEQASAQQNIFTRTEMLSSPTKPREERNKSRGKNSLYYRQQQQQQLELQEQQRKAKRKKKSASQEKDGQKSYMKPLDRKVKKRVQRNGKIGELDDYLQSGANPSEGGVE